MRLLVGNHSPSIAKQTRRTVPTRLIAAAAERSGSIGSIELPFPTLLGITSLCVPTSEVGRSLVHKNQLSLSGRRHVH